MTKANNEIKKSKKPFIITEEIIGQATTYISFSEKMVIVEELAKGCLEPVDKIIGDIAAETSLPIPQLYKEKSGAKQYFLMYYFLKEYLHIEIKDEDWNSELFDFYSSSHVFNQVERFKAWAINRDFLKDIPVESPTYALKLKQLKEKETEIKNKVFDILYDFKELKKMLETEIFNLKESRNNTLDRIQNSISLFASPENVKQLNDLLQKSIGEVETAQKKVAKKRTAATTSKKETVE